MKRKSSAFVLLLAGVLCLCLLSACGSDNQNTGGGAGSNAGNQNSGGAGGAGNIEQSGPQTPDEGEGQERPYTVSSDGTKISFGEYPQSEVTESRLKRALTAEAGTVPTSWNAGKWKSYEYYISGLTQKFMWYTDVEYQGGRYRGVYFTQYRPYDTMSGSMSSNSYQDDNGYHTGIVYWFAYEPIEWRILEQGTDEALLMANVILDSLQFYHTTSTRSGSKTVYPNNYRESDVRKWLTETFYETAFDEAAQSAVGTAEVDNSASTTASDYNAYACENTQDTVFLLSYREATNAAFGLNTAALRLKGTAYAKSQGLFVNKSGFVGNGRWWLRSPSHTNGSNAFDGNADGSVSYDGMVTETDGGVVPALRIRL